MLFPTIDFAVFFSIVFPTTWTLNQYNAWRKAVLVLASYFFYGFWSVRYLVLLISISLCAFLFAKLLGRQSNRSIRLTLLWLGVAASIGILAYFKYYNFLVANLINSASTIGISIDLPFVELATPCHSSRSTCSPISSMSTTSSSIRRLRSLTSCYI
jgi:alginate O-acetyltransferase complex protein AlgI